MAVRQELGFIGRLRGGDFSRGFQADASRRSFLVPPELTFNATTVLVQYPSARDFFARS
jgi:hypothetical protein